MYWYYFTTETRIKSWISIYNYIEIVECIIYPFLYFNGGLSKQPLPVADYG